MSFKIDGVEMPRPSSWLVNPKPMAADAERVAGTGEAIVPYLRTVYEVIWEYKYLSQAEYKRLYDAYIKSTIDSMSMYHTLTTLDSNTGDVMELSIYTQGDFTAPLYRIKDGIRYYKDVKFVFVSR